jgi:hypothetical protein
MASGTTCRDQRKLSQASAVANWPPWPLVTLPTTSQRRVAEHEIAAMPADVGTSAMNQREPFQRSIVGFERAVPRIVQILAEAHDKASK